MFKPGVIIVASELPDVNIPGRRFSWEIYITAEKVLTSSDRTCSRKCWESCSWRKLTHLKRTSSRKLGRCRKHIWKYIFRKIHFRRKYTFRESTLSQKVHFQRKYTWYSLEIRPSQVGDIGRARLWDALVPVAVPVLKWKVFGVYARMKSEII